MATFYTPLVDGQPNRAATFNAALQQMEVAITARDGAMISRAGATLSVDAPSITIDVVVGDGALMLVSNLRTDRAGNANDNVRMTFNDDISSSYMWRYILGDTGGAPTTTGSSSTSGFSLDYAATGATAPANTYASLMLRIPLASNTVLKPCSYDIVQADSSTAIRIVIGSAWYPTAVAISRIKLVPINGTVFKAGSSYSLYGMN